MKILFALLFLLYPLQDNIVIENSWIRNSSKGMNTALFFDVHNNGSTADTLYKVSSELAELVQIHETFMQDDMMGMREVKDVVIEPGSTFRFKPKSHHVMLIKLKQDLNEGEEGEVTLFFRNAGEIKISAPVKKMKMH